MAGRFPDDPFCVPDTTPVVERVAALNELADEGVTSPEVQAIARQARVAALGKLPLAPVRNGDVYARLLALEILTRVHRLGYKPITDGRDCYQPAAYTARFGGECKALTVLFVSVARALGLRADPVWIDQPGADLNHVAAKLRVDGQDLWVESSIPGAMLGESPEHAAARRGAWATLGRGAEVSAAGQTAIRAFRPGGVWPWTGWNTVWRGWPTSWFQLYYPSLFALPVYGGVQLVSRPARLYPWWSPYGPVAFPYGLRIGAVYVIRPRVQSPPHVGGQTPQPTQPAPAP